VTSSSDSHPPGQHPANPDGPQDSTSDRQFSTNLARGLDVLRAFSASNPVLTNRAISDRTGLPKATVSRLTYTLSLYGYLVQEESGAFRLGTALLGLSHPVLASMPIRQIARPFLQALAAETGFTVNLALCERVSAVYIDTVRADLVNPYLPDVGTVSPLLQSAIGRALILGHAGIERERLLNRIKVSAPQNFDTGMQLLAEDTKLFQTSGYCRARGPWLADIDAIAIPLPLPRRFQPAAINCTVSIGAPHRTRLEHSANSLKATAQALSDAYARNPVQT
jgi:DNA-binding IclR family transcriptional regulator